MIQKVIWDTFLEILKSNLFLTREQEWARAVALTTTGIYIYTGWPPAALRLWFMLSGNRQQDLK